MDCVGRGCNCALRGADVTRTRPSRMRKCAPAIVREPEECRTMRIASFRDPCGCRYLLNKAALVSPLGTDIPRKRDKWYSILISNSGQLFVSRIEHRFRLSNIHYRLVSSATYPYIINQQRSKRASGTYLLQVAMLSELPLSAPVVTGVLDIYPVP